MAATVVHNEPTNDTKKIATAMTQLGKDIGDIEKSLAKLKKLQASIAKKPDECAKTCKDLYAEIGSCQDAVSDLSDLTKTLQKAAVK